MHYHEIKDKLIVGEQVYICDYRFNSLDDKPIRHIKPMKVAVCNNEDLPKNKTVYYSEIHFKPIGANGKVQSRIIAPFDNTGYRSYTGTSLNIFFTEEECIKCFKQQCKEIIKNFKKAKENKLQYYDKKIVEVENEMNEQGEKN